MLIILNNSWDFLAIHRIPWREILSLFIVSRLPGQVPAPGERLCRYLSCCSDCFKNNTMECLATYLYVYIYVHIESNRCYMSIMYELHEPSI